MFTALSRPKWSRCGRTDFILPFLTVDVIASVGGEPQFSLLLICSFIWSIKHYRTTGSAVVLIISTDVLKIMVTLHI